MNTGFYIKRYGNKQELETSLEGILKLINARDFSLHIIKHTAYENKSGSLISQTSMVCSQGSTLNLPFDCVQRYTELDNIIIIVGECSVIENIVTEPPDSMIVGINRPISFSKAIILLEYGFILQYMSKYTLECVECPITKKYKIFQTYKGQDGSQYSEEFRPSSHDMLYGKYDVLLYENITYNNICTMRKVIR